MSCPGSFCSKSGCEFIGGVKQKPGGWGGVPTPSATYSALMLLHYRPISKYLAHGITLTCRRMYSSHT